MENKIEIQQTTSQCKSNHKHQVLKIIFIFTEVNVLLNMTLGE